MAIVLTENTNVLVQGITGREGQRATAAMRDYHTNVVCGVTPGKGGQNVDGVPVYDTIHEALERHSEVNASAIFVPPVAAKDAVLEAISHDIPLINILTERIPVRDTAYFLDTARERGTRIVGPASIGILSPGLGRIGMVGGPHVEKVYTPGSIGVISKSGGMTNETSWVIRQAGLGQSTVIAIGGDLLIGSNFKDLLELFEQDEQTKGVVMFGELGGTYEEEAAEFISSGGFTKPVAAFVGGKFATALPEGTPIGHAGALIEGGKGGPEEKERILKDAGVLIAERFEELGHLIGEAVGESTAINT
ncbi:MAG: CoA-binding protein [Candidatus Doudnabacteria bacterium]|nr:CoA-binding protein [Candidatus Doudnabacteria bacterium]MCA9387667.1 CoA-binding protein [Candidatus Andersenbacteria bacterium]